MVKNAIIGNIVTGSANDELVEKFGHVGKLGTDISIMGLGVFVGVGVIVGTAVGVHPFGTAVAIGSTTLAGVGSAGAIPNVGVGQRETNVSGVGSTFAGASPTAMRQSTNAANSRITRAIKNFFMRCPLLEGI
ncbi:MAG: hypothetical protein ACEQSA_04585 [Weeksellaceae bacterium]